ncbi:MAG TPA: hypothetical protein VJ691_02815 [Vicinamibacterales bacterium]|nr:hypothetical protein [Vicinamibacterales bacterium]
MPSDELKALARAYAAKIVSGEISPSDGARAMWTDVFYHLEMGDHFVDGFIFWGYELDTAETDARRWFCEAAITALARRMIEDEPTVTNGAGHRIRPTLDDLAGVQFLEPWHKAVPGLEAELRNEVGEGHALYGRKAISVARRRDSDDVLFLLLDHPSPLAVVHLTWTGRRERNSNWPQTTFYTSLHDWVERCMKVDHEEFST